MLVLLISVCDIAHADFRFIYNNHTYDIITTALTWEKANIAAKKSSVNGVSGYLVQINSEKENNKILDFLKLVV